MLIESAYKKLTMTKNYYAYDENNPYEAKWYPVIKDEDNVVLQTEYRIAKHIRNVLRLDDEKELLP